MLASILRSKRAVLVNIQIMRTFVRLRQMLASNAELSRRFDELESKYDHKFKVVFDAIPRLNSRCRYATLDKVNADLNRDRPDLRVRHSLTAMCGGKATIHRCLSSLVRCADSSCKVLYLV